jgi:DNA polymerase III epsilon subunit-like protein
MKNYYIVLDTETANGLDDPLTYDIGFAVIDKKGKVYEKHSYIIKDIFVYMPELMKTAYYANKISIYIADLDAGTRELKTFFEVRRIINEVIKKYNIKALMAHNARFDIKALNTTIRYLTKSKCRYFLPYEVTVWDTLAMARTTIGKQKTYVNWCKKNNYLTKNGQVRLTAEILHRYLTLNNNFKESHTGLEDVLIEKDIFVRCERQHKKMNRTYWKIKEAV